jgi:hypothetical protein
MSSARGPLIARLIRWVAFLIAVPCQYVLSSGPMPGPAFRLCEATGNDAFYLVMWVYYSLIAAGHGNPVDVYIEWWGVDVFHTVGPG